PRDVVPLGGPGGQGRLRGRQIPATAVSRPVIGHGRGAYPAPRPRRPHTAIASAIAVSIVTTAIAASASEVAAVMPDDRASAPWRACRRSRRPWPIPHLAWPPPQAHRLLASVSNFFAHWESFAEDHHMSAEPRLLDAVRGQPKQVWITAFAAVIAFMGIGLVDPILLS